MARKMNERPKRVNVSARLDVWCSGLFIPLAKTQRRIIRNSRHVQLRPRQHSAPLHAGGQAWIQDGCWRATHVHPQPSPWLAPAIPRRTILQMPQTRRLKPSFHLSLALLIELE